ncbi:MAG: TIGR01777 family oxidoreductase [Ignavibacteriaceae bacterium]|nr:TIGR01777 family oxidoreductase [Ignavibacteriaceae bacterium]
MSKEIILTGATGLIGSKLFLALIRKGYSVKVFSRNPIQAKKTLAGAAKYVYWDYTEPELWQSEVEGVHSVIHLAGANLFGKRWTTQYKNIIADSRITSTKNIVTAIKKSVIKPSVFICSSAVGIYGGRGEEILTEEAPAGNDFLAKVCLNWEVEAQAAKQYGVRVVNIRTGIVLAKEGGSFPLIKRAFSFFVGGPLGSGNQYFPWVHADDVVAAYLFTLESEPIYGGVNTAAPDSITMNQFSNKLGKQMSRPSAFKVPGFALNIAVGEFGKSIIASQRAVPEKLLNNGFEFKFKNLESALEDLLEK